MNKMRTVTLSLALLTLAATAFAQPEVPSWGRAYLSFSPDGIDRSRDVEPFEPVPFYLLMELDLPPGETVTLGAVEGSFHYEPSLFLSKIDWAGGDHFDIGRGLQAGTYDFQVAWNGGQEPVLADGLNVIGQFTGVLLEDDDLLIGIGPSSVCPSREDCTPLRWVTHPVDIIYRADVGPVDGGVVLNRPWTGVATNRSSWSLLKATFEP
jgi:hypothetical protein